MGAGGVVPHKRVKGNQVTGVSEDSPQDTLRWISEYQGIVIAGSRISENQNKKLISDQKQAKSEKICKNSDGGSTAAPPERPSLWACPVSYGAGLSKFDKKGYNSRYYGTAEQ